MVFHLKPLEQFLKARNVNIPGGNLEIQGVKVPAQITGEYKKC